MSADPVSRRARAIDTLIRNMAASNEGWTTPQIIHFLVRQYGYGIREKTASDILMQLSNMRVLYQKGLKWYVRKA